MLYYSIIIPLLLATSLALYIIPRIIMVSVKKELMGDEALVRDGRVRRNVPRFGGVSLFPILVISVGLPLKSFAALKAASISSKLWAHISAASPVFVSYAKIINYPRLLVTICLTKICHWRYSVEGHIFYPFAHFTNSA